MSERGSQYFEISLQTDGRNHQFSVFTAQDVGQLVPGLLLLAPDGSSLTVEIQRKTFSPLTFEHLSPFQGKWVATNVDNAEEVVIACGVTRDEAAKLAETTGRKAMNIRLVSRKDGEG